MWDEIKSTLTFWQETVGVTFNPSGLLEVDKFKISYAQIIDWLNDLRNSCDNPVVKRLASEAITNTENACMWAVKAIVKSVQK